MFEQIDKIVRVMIDSFLSIWPYLVLTIPLAVFINISGISKKIHKIFKSHPISAIFIATLIGAFSPFCSCGIIPIIASLLISGIPLGPVMSFWIASPSMDPEIFFLGVGTIGWELAFWRLGATLLISLSSGFITHYLIHKGWIGKDILKKNFGSNNSATNTLNQTKSEPITTTTHKLFSETKKAIIMVAKFMAFAFFLEAIIRIYIPSEWIIYLLGKNNSLSILISTLFGIPFYTSGLTALPLVKGLMAQGMLPASGLAFLIAGPATTLPAMSAVWLLVTRRVFILYLTFILMGALIFGYLFLFIG